MYCVILTDLQTQVKSFIYIITLSVVLSSCSGLSFTHRRYTPGFFKEHLAQRNKLSPSKQKLAFKEKVTDHFSYTDSSLLSCYADTLQESNNTEWHVFGKAFNTPASDFNSLKGFKKYGKTILPVKDDFNYGRYVLLMLLCLLIGAGSMFVYIFAYQHILFSFIGFAGILAAICLAAWILAELIIAMLNRPKKKKPTGDEVMDDVSRSEFSRKRKTMKLLFIFDIAFTVLTLLVGSYGFITLSVITQLIALVIYLIALFGKRKGKTGDLEFKKINKLFLMKTALLLLIILLAFLLA